MAAALADGRVALECHDDGARSVRPSAYRAAIIKLPLGDASAEQLRSIAELARKFGNGTVRATNQQNLVLRFVPSMKLYALYRELVESASARPTRSTSPTW